jgi:hypothetical protein
MGNKTQKVLPTPLYCYPSKIIVTINNYYWFSATCKFNINGFLLIIPLFMHCYFIDTLLFFYAI